jgi:hypothetical protein
MTSRAKMVARIRERKGEYSVLPPPQQTSSTSLGSHLNEVFLLQRTIGNRAVQRFFDSNLIRGKMSTGTIKDRNGHFINQVPSALTGAKGGKFQRQSRNALGRSILQRQMRRRCQPSSTNLRTRMMKKKPPKTYYGANYRHKFDTVPKGCSLRNVQVSEVVSTVRDDFQVNPPYIPVGKNIWRLTGKNELDKPDSIWTPAGANGIGSRPLRNWPAILDQNQIWYYRYSSKDRWRGPGPGIILRVTLDGDPRKRETLKVTTTSNGVSRQEPYKGPGIRLRQRRRRRRP